MSNLSLSEVAQQIKYEQNNERQADSAAASSRASVGITAAAE